MSDPSSITGTSGGAGGGAGDADSSPTTPASSGPTPAPSSATSTAPGAAGAPPAPADEQPTGSATATSEDPFAGGPVVCFGGTQGPIASAVHDRLDAHGYGAEDQASVTHATEQQTQHFGPASVAALEQFQRDHNLPVTGSLDDRTWEALQGQPQRDTTGE